MAETVQSTIKGRHSGVGKQEVYIVPVMGGCS